MNRPFLNVNAHILQSQLTGKVLGDAIHPDAIGSDAHFFTSKYFSYQLSSTSVTVISPLMIFSRISFSWVISSSVKCRL